MKRWIGPVLLLACLVVANQYLPGWQRSIDGLPTIYHSRRRALLDIFGESRTLVAHWLWFKMDVYHEALEREGAVGTVREGQLFPLLRLATELDPKMQEAYDIMSWDLYHFFHEPQKAMELLREGLHYNPRSRLLQFRAALILTKMGDYRQGLAHAREAYLLSNELAGVRNMSTQKINALNAVRLMFVCQEGLKDVPGMKNSLAIWATMRPDDPVLKRHRRAMLAIERQQRKK